MKAMILAAGRGERMRPLTDSTPKPLLRAGGSALVHRVIASLRIAGISDLVINVSHLGAMTESALGDGAAFGVRIAYSREAEALETAGGIAYALPLLGAEPFLVVNGDLYTDFDMTRLAAVAPELSASGTLAHLVLVDNPPHNANGDFGFDGSHVVGRTAAVLTFSGMGAYHPALFSHVARGSRARLADVLAGAIAQRRVTGEHFRGCWVDVGTVERLAALDRAL